MCYMFRKASLGETPALLKGVTAWHQGDKPPAARGADLGMVLHYSP